MQTRNYSCSCSGQWTMVGLGLIPFSYLELTFPRIFMYAHWYVPKIWHVSWLHAWVAGVQGISGEDSCIALCADESSGERGIAAIQVCDSPSRSNLHVLEVTMLKLELASQNIRAEQVVLQAPMRLAITDHFDEAALQEAGLEGWPDLTSIYIHVAAFLCNV